jgi:hypothetical protein
MRAGSPNASRCAGWARSKSAFSSRSRASLRPGCRPATTDYRASTQSESDPAARTDTRFRPAMGRGGVIPPIAGQSPTMVLRLAARPVASRIGRHVGKNGSCSGLDRPARPSASYRLTPLSTTRSTLSAILPSAVPCAVSWPCPEGTPLRGRGELDRSDHDLRMT